MTVQRTRVLVVGSLNVDLVVQVEMHPGPGETVLGEDVRTFPGGKGANQAAAAARAGGKVCMLGRVGTDAYGQSLKDALAEVGVDTRQLLEQPGPTGMAFITVDASGQNMIVVSSGANRHLSPEDVTPELFDGVGIVLMQLENPLETVQRVAELAEQIGVPVMLNAAPGRPLDDALLKRLSYLVVNESEAALLSGQVVSDIAGAQVAAGLLRARGTANVVVTLGGQGVVWEGTGSRGQLPAHQVTVVDTTAAGDAFCGALAVRLAEGAELEEAVRFANAAGALATTSEGAQPSLPLRNDIEALMSL
ncbi:MAG: ribokinase [Trueperaceae bacterium]|nr:MAG: ribokinase [Trueperaceae bacterium]